MQQCYGALADSYKNYESTLTRRTLDLQQYLVTHLASCTRFYNVTSELQGLPNFMVWYDNQLDLSDYIPLPPKMILDTLACYMANMTDEERALFDPTLERLMNFHDVFRITCIHDGFEVFTTVAGKPKLLLVTVMNMMDTSIDNPETEHWRNRPSLN